MRSFLWAFRGIGYSIATQRNMRIHLCFAFYVACFGVITRISPGEWTAVLLCIGTVTALESVNTALETLCDTLCPEKNQGIGRAKDAAAGAVLLAAVASACVGGVVFFRGDRISAALEFFGNNPLKWAAMALSMALAILFIRGKKQNSH